MTIKLSVLEVLEFIKGINIDWTACMSDDIAYGNREIRREHTLQNEASKNSLTKQIFTLYRDSGWQRITTQERDAEVEKLMIEEYGANDYFEAEADFGKSYPPNGP